MTTPFKCFRRKIPHPFSFQGMDGLECGVHVPRPTLNHFTHPGFRRKVAWRSIPHGVVDLVQGILVRRGQGRRWDLLPVNQIRVHSLEEEQGVSG